ncbi:DUF4231 domain-containing protein [Pseudoalteromonas luteoviolacea]|uniref:DUF4231 domain-containing protein n=1 Tax=Pseudoalteromonas luteoviolacea S4054 TaxID=1129367 RepID=A0A0F6AFU2_9GAMM|nr:DUF4231 domain-containing protein [Pseudoalteromonas luteoviolacea]AOT08312.1 hypothetical protein S4054249_10850 [Pseudoalteromonas luteoviolacea]AOT13228.1 hypothetical protein S40542_10825 [Pseudoalteromonas luteoviolacea]AOT18141.1 hypothetical protein S4054_10825 [Pseudoalteromonas luteoviolacea]KKE84249.1 hypothetical protein N479_10140 [Pseudoalteromonas luteoviolacea S4054]KZN76146.1 hypothetical protein N481_07275 [Pseudoalteromonas luteoviolacea S4047-1]
MNKEQYLKDRVDNQINWYNKKSKSNQMWFKSLRIIEIVSAAIIPFVAGYSNSIPHGMVFIGVLGVIIAICAALTALNKYQENWLVYRTTCEALLQEKFLFMTNAKPYNNEEAFSKFVTRVESLLSKENTQWARSVKEKPNSKSK